MKKLLWFAIAGGCGFAIDALITLGLIAYTPAGPFFARFVAIAAAMVFTWMINRTFTFGRSNRSVAQEGFWYGFVGLISAALNYALYSVLLLRTPILQPFAALVLASLAAMAFSFFGYSRFVFRR